MKKIFAGAALAAVVSVGLIASSALADIYYTNVSWSLEDTDNNDFSETLTLGPTAVDTSGNTAYFSTFTLNQGDTSNPYTFNSPYTDGFVIKNQFNDILFQADVELASLEAIGIVGLANPTLLHINLSNIEVSTTSIYYSDFGSVTEGMMSINLTSYSTTASLASLISSGTTASGTATVTAHPVPEPGVTLLFGLGVAGFAGVIRRKKTIVA